jgi:hypothetical protein
MAKSRVAAAGGISLHGMAVPWLPERTARPTTHDRPTGALDDIVQKLDAASAG